MIDERVVYILTEDDDYRVGTVDDILSAKPNQDERGCFPCSELMTVFADIITNLQGDGHDGAPLTIQLRDEQCIT